MSIYKGVSCLIVQALLLTAPPAYSQSESGEVIEELVVTASFREVPPEELPASITVLNRDFIQKTTVQHFEELIPFVPNMSFSGEGNRARYILIRGVGELEQYEGAPNPSVGFIVDDIDFSAIGGVATLFDTGQVEVLRGPQGTRYGANALAGLKQASGAGAEVNSIIALMGEVESDRP